MTNVARHIISKFGDGDFKVGVPVVAGILGLDVTRVYRMTYPKNKGGTGGLVPAQHQQPLLEQARVRSVDLRPEDFFTPIAAE